MALLVCAGCASATGASRTNDTANGVDGDWRITFPQFGAASPTMTVREGQVSGAGACNRFSGPVRTAERSVRFGAMAMTEMACAPELMDHDATLMDALAQTRSLERVGDTVSFINSSGETVLQAARIAELSEVVDVDWVMADGAWNERAPSLRLSGDRATGFTGCNRWFSAATLTQERLSFSDLGMTKMACTGAAGRAERTMIDALERARRYRVEGNFLVLLDEDGRTLLRFAPAS